LRSAYDLIGAHFAFEVNPMARRIRIKVPSLPATSTLFTVTHTPIGDRRGVTNKRTADVQLVQFFLKHFYAANPRLYAQLPKTKNGKFLIDGDCGAQTKSGIWVYQTYEQKRGNGIYPDGVVDPATTYANPNSINAYTILALNTWYIDNTDGANYLDLENHPDIRRDAPELYIELAGTP
jgi:hypothetical protein